MSNGPIDRYLDVLRYELPVPMPRLLTETREHLQDAAHRFASMTLDREEAERMAIDAYGEPRVIAEAVAAEGGIRMTSRKIQVLTGVATLLVLPAILFVSSSLLKYQGGYEAIYDGFFGTVFDQRNSWELPLNLLIVLGPVLALALVGFASTRFGLSRLDGSVEASVVVRMNKWMIATTLASILVLAAMLAYLLLENLPCMVGGRVTC